MSRPDDRPLRRLPTLEARKDALERCVFCPKLCRSACPVSNAEPRETLTPWGKMSMAYFAANGSVATAPSFAAPAWACTGCFACRSQCDHQNDVAGTLFEARSALVSAGVAPEAATRTIARFQERAAALADFASELSARGDAREDVTTRTAVLVGCAYARHARDEARDAVRSVAALAREEVSVVKVCCGAPLLYAGDTEGFRRQGEELARAVRGAERLVVVDAGCASALRVHHANAGTGVIVPVEHLTERAARDLGRLGRARPREGAVRWHDPCQLGRGLGVYEAPRALLSRALGRAPDEFPRSRDASRCSGAGGLLPLTMPETSRAVTASRVDEHDRAGGGTIVTACASSLRAFRKQGARAVDLATILAEALGVR